MSIVPTADSPEVATLLTQIAPRAPSLVVTVWGDMIAPSGRPIWLGSLIRAVEDFGLNERVVRTAVFRLVRDGWLYNVQQGRRSYYGLADRGLHLTRAADVRIYRATPDPWRGEWLVLMLPSERAEVPEKLRRELSLLGFGTVSPGVFVRPDANFAPVAEILQDFGLTDRAVALKSGVELMPGLSPMQQLIGRAWDLSAIDAGYQEFIANFAPWASKGAHLSARDCFLLRTLLVHQFRRCTLRDPMLPQELMAADWSGLAARRLAGEIYREIAAGALAHAQTVLETREGTLPNPGEGYYHRFGGLDS